MKLRAIANAGADVGDLWEWGAEGWYPVDPTSEAFREGRRTQSTGGRLLGDTRASNSTGGRSWVMPGNLAISERLPPMASTVLRSVESSRLLRRSSYARRRLG